MKKCYFTLLLLFTCSLCLNAQGIRYGSRVTLKGQVLDAKTQRPIPFANIGFVGKGIGTVSDEYGNYALEFPPAKLESIDHLQFSVVGYKPQAFSKNEILLTIQKPLNIYLKPEQYQLDELVLGESKRRTGNIGDLDYDERIVGYWKDIEGLGGEILTKIKVRRKNTKLHNLKFKVLENGSDSLLVRVNVYDVDRGLVGRSLLQESIQYTLDAKTGLISIPLEKYNVVVNENIIVGIELLKVYGRQIGFSLAGSRTKGISFVRYRSQDTYKIEDDVSMAFELEVSTPDKKRNSTDKRELPDHITLYWDMSASESLRNIPKELAIIESVLGKTKEAQVDIVKFSMQSRAKKTFYMHKGKADPIIEFLREGTFHGFGQIDAVPRPENLDNSAVLLVTAGQTFLSDVIPDFPAPVFVITTNPEANFDALDNLVVYSDGDILDGSKETVKEITKRFTHFIDEEPIATIPEYVASGKVQFKQGDSIIALQGATVTVRGTYKNTQTSSKGTYRIAATPEDILTVEFPGMKSQNVRVHPEGKTDIVLNQTFEMLDQVIILGAKEEEVLIDTPTGKRKENAIAYRNNVLNEEDIPATAISLGDVLRQASNIQVLFDPISRQEIYIFPRTYYSSILNPQPPLVVIDEMIYQQNGNTVLPQIDAQNIRSISYSSSLMAGAKYGSLAAGGVINVKTKALYPNMTISEKEASLLVKGNDYENDNILNIKDLEPSDVLKRLSKGTSLSSEKEIYLNLLKSRTNEGLDFYMAGYSFFKERDPVFALETILSMVAKAPQNKQVLRAVGYALQDLEQHELAVALYKHILSIAPNDIQSYRDLAHVHLKHKNFEESFELYKTILANNIEGLEFNPLQETAENELRRLLAFHKSKVSYQDLPEDFLAQKFKRDYHLVFEWNDPSLQFELQFVNPDNKYFTWDHTIYNNQKRIISDLTNGLMIKEFEIENFPKGRWLINLKKMSGASQIAGKAYLKYSLYTDYATPNEKEHTKIISLDNLNEKITIDQITLNTTDYEN